MAKQSGRSPQNLLREFIEKVLGERRIGWVESLCYHRVKLFDARCRQYYSVPAVQEQLLHLFSAYPDIQFEVLQELSDSHTKSGAAAMVHIKIAGREYSGFIMVRTTRERITTLRFLFNVDFDVDVVNISLNSFPAAEVKVASVPNKIYMMYSHLKEAEIFPQIENYLYALAGLPRTESSGAPETLQDPQVCELPGSVYLADIMGKRIGPHGYAYILAWYKGLLLPQGNVTVGGGSYIELNERELMRDIRVYDDSSIS